MRILSRLPHRPNIWFATILVASLLTLLPDITANRANAFVGSTELEGRIVFWRTSKITTPISGRIDTIPHRVGDSVKKGDIIATIDARQLEADLAIAKQQLESAKAELESAQARFKLDQAVYDRIEKLKKSSAFSLARFEDATNQLGIATASLNAARARISEREASVSKHQLDVELATIKAPFDGIIVNHILTVGGLVSRETPHILQMVDNTSPEIQVDVPVDLVSALQSGTELQVSIGDKAKQKARVRAILPAQKTDATTRLVLLELVDKNGAYSDTSSVKISLPES